jgi:murein DD-endopeptidase MepM/ murein hydrolase activator NlpD
MRERFYNVIIVPHASAKFRKIRIPFRLIVIGGVLLASLLVLLGFFIYNYAEMKVRVRDIDSFSAENQRLKAENQRYEVSTQFLSEKILEMEAYTKKLNTIAGIDPNQEMVKFGGVGDLGDVVTGEKKDVLEEELPALKKKAFDLERSFHYLVKFYEKQTILLASTPSIWPTRGYLSSGFGYRKDPFTGGREFHKGLDIATRRGNPIVAPADGIVIKAGSSGGYGNVVVIKHQFGFVTRYGHLNRFVVQVGSKVRRGDIIGYVGTSGRSIGPHLHYEVLRNGKPVNPLHYIIEKYKVF